MRLAKKILYILGVAVVFACMVGTGYWLSFLQTSTERWFRVAKVSSSSASEPYECEITSTGGVYLDAGNEKVTESRLTQGEKMTFKFRANGDEKSATMIASSAIGITEQTVRDA